MKLNYVLLSNDFMIFLMFRKNGNTIIGSECEKFTAESMTFKKFDKFEFF